MNLFILVISINKNEVNNKKENPIIPINKT